MTDIVEPIPEAPDHGTVHLDDDFAVDLPPGRVIGTATSSGEARLGVDVEQIMTVDHGALRIRPLAKPGWGREGIAYGPYRRRAGLAFAAHVLNGHNASQTFYEPETSKQRLRRIISDARRGRFRRPKHFENLAVGWFTSATPSDPLKGGNGFVMHAADGDNGELWVTGSGRPMRAVRGVQNLQILYVVILRTEGAAYYAATVDGARGLGSHPHMRPLGIDPTATEDQLYPGVHQRILGEVAYRVDTRVYRTRVAELEHLCDWYGTAHVADRLDGPSRPDQSDAEVGGAWTPWISSPEDAGSVATMIEAPSASGLLHALVEAGGQVTPVGLLFRAAVGRGWRATIGPAGCELAVNEGDGWRSVAEDPSLRAAPNGSHALQILDDGDRIAVYVDGRLAFDRWILDGRLADERGVGFHSASGGTTRLRRFEAHARSIPIPASLDLGPPWAREGTIPEIEEHFDGPAGPLDGTTTPSGGRRWERSFGLGSIELTGHASARVDATTDRPNPGRTVYTVPWDDPAFVDITVDMVPPGTGRHQGEEFRGGLVLWQDPDNFVVLNLFLDNVYDGSSVSTFYHLGGHEDMYDAVWSLVGPVRWGVPCSLRVVSDGWQFVAYLDGEPVLYRALRDVYPWTERLAIERVGLVANEEWGDDTGTVFRSLVASRRAAEEGST